MNRFLNDNLIFDYENGLFELIIERVLKCSKKMVEDNVSLANNEPKIAAHLVETYLNNDKFLNEFSLPHIPIRFDVETSENYNEYNNSYVGRTDIRAVSTTWLFSNKEAYYLIECKKIDGGKRLNREYVTEGIQRFVSGKYSSYYGKNIMFGFVVKNINVCENVNKINTIHADKLGKSVKQNLLLSKCESEEHWIYSSFYDSNGKNLELCHLFYDFSSIIE